MAGLGLAAVIGGGLLALPLFAVGALVVALFAAQAADDAAGCGSVDPTDPANYSTVSIVNDTDQAVVIDDCPGAYCHADELPVRLRPGQRFSDNAACGATGEGMTAWRVRASAGSVLGWVAVDSPRSTTGLVFKVSNVSQSSAVATPQG